jgi:hypothetical protein
MSQRENKVEAYLKLRMTAIGGAAEKHVNPGANGDPDRLLSFPLGYKCLVETKWAEDASMTAPHARRQLRRHAWWQQRGMDVYLLKSKAQVDSFIIKMWELGYWQMG